MREKPSVRVSPGVEDGGARRKVEVPESLLLVPKAPPSEEMMDLQLARVLVVRELAADLAVRTTGGVLRALVGPALTRELGLTGV